MTTGGTGAPSAESAAHVPHAEAVKARRIPPIKLWAAAGALFLAFQAYVYIKWITGPYFETVPSGPSQPPEWMKVSLIIYQVVGPLAALAIIYLLVVRPWRRNRQVGVYGVLAVAGLGAVFLDCVPMYTTTWMTYNSYMVNFGAWVNEIPGSTNLASPGQMFAEPLLFVVPAFVYLFVAAAAFGAFVMRRLRRRWPRMRTPTMIGMCFVVMVAVDVVLEGLIWMRLGVFTLGGLQIPGMHLVLFGKDEYYQYPLDEGLLLGAVLTAVACLVYFVNDRGETIVERGLSEIRGSETKKLGLRILAMVSGLSLAIFVPYHIPMTIWSPNQAAWPRGMQERSYFTDYVCGEGTNRVCPGPRTPTGRQGAPNLGPGGTIVRPDGVKLPAVVPFKRE